MKNVNVDYRGIDYNDLKEQFDTLVQEEVVLERKLKAIKFSKELLNRVIIAKVQQDNKPEFR